MTDNEPLEVHYAKINSKKFVVYIQRGPTVIELAWPRSETKAESIASVIGATIAVASDNLAAAAAIRDPDG